MVEPKIKIYVKRQHRTQGSRTSFLKEYKTDGTAQKVVEATFALMEAREPYFEVHFPNGIKSVYQKKSYEQNYNKKDVKILKPLD